MLLYILVYCNNMPLNRLMKDYRRPRLVVEEVATLQGELGYFGRVAANRGNTSLLDKRLGALAFQQTEALTHAVMVGERLEAASAPDNEREDAPSPSCFAGLDTSILYALAERALENSTAQSEPESKLA